MIRSLSFDRNFGFRTTLLLLLTVASVACQPLPAQERVLAVSGGTVLLYAEPSATERELQRFELVAISAVAEDDSEHPLELLVSDCSLAALGQQRLLASARLPVGRYRGFFVQSKSSVYAVEEGATPPPPRIDETTIAWPFSVTLDQPQLVFLGVSTPRGIADDGRSPPPVFAPATPSKPLPGLTGYVSSRTENFITVFDRKTWKVAKAIPTGGGPAGLALDAPRKRLYVALTRDDAIDVVDTETLERIARVRLNLGDEPLELALAPDGSTLLCVNRRSNTLSIVDPDALIERQRLNVGNGPTSLVVAPSGRQAFVFNTLADTMTVIDLLNREVLATLPVEAAPLRGAFNKRGDRLLIIHERSPYLLVIDPGRLQIVKRIDVGTGALWLKIDPVTDLIYLSRRQDRVIRIFDPFSLLPSGFILAGGDVAHMTVDRELNQMLLTVPQRKVLQIYNLLSRQAVAEIDFGTPPGWVTVSGER